MPCFLVYAYICIQVYFADIILPINCLPMGSRVGAKAKSDKH